MHTHLKKLTYKMYLLSGVVLLALLFAIWLFSNAFLSIKVSPREATVTVDGEQIDLNSFGIGKKRLPLGSHFITVESDGYVSYIKTVKFKRGFTTGVNVTLREMPEATTIAEGGKFLVKGNDSNEFFYLSDNDSTIYRSKIEPGDNNEIAISSYPVTKPDLYGINDIIWSPKKDLALFKKDDGVYMFDFNKYDFINQTETLWGNNIGSIAWSPDNSKIAYYYAPANGEQSIIFSSLDNKNKERIVNLADFGIKNPTLHWSPDSEWLLVIPKNDGSSSNKIYLLNAYSKEFKAITEDGNVLDATFASDNNKILYSSYTRETSPRISEILKDGSNNFEYDLNGEIKNISFMADPKNILVAKSNTEGSSIFKFDLSGNAKKDFAINFSDGTRLSAVTTNKDDKIVIYTNDYGIFAIPMDQLVTK